MVFLIDLNSKPIVLINSFSVRYLDEHTRSRNTDKLVAASYRFITSSFPSTAISEEYLLNIARYKKPRILQFSQAFQQQ